MNSAQSSIHLAVHKRRDMLIVSDTSVKRTRAVLSQGGPRDAAVNFDKKNLQRHRAVSVPRHGFPV